MVCETSPNLKRAAARYTRGMAIAGASYVAVVAGAVTVIDRLAPPHWAVLALALAPLLPAALMLRTYLVFFREMDEFQRRIQSEAIMIAAGMVGFGSFAYSFLEEWADFPRIDLIWIFPALILSWGAASIFVRLRYK